MPTRSALLIAAGLALSLPLPCAAQSGASELAGAHAAPLPPAIIQTVPPRVEPVEPIAEVEIPIVDAPPPAAPAMMDLTAAPTSLWQRIRNGFGLPDMASALVREQEEWFAQRPEYIKRTVARSSRYLYHIVEELEKRGMPTELALLPIIESAYNPTAYSRSHASGIWQFIPSTGKLYGLQQNFWYDGRRDVLAATGAALDYLQKLYETFGSWDLALAAYNWGEGALGRAIAKNQARGQAADYQSLTMPPETRYYMPKLQAVKNIIANPAQFGIELADVQNQPYFVAVTTTRHIDVKLAARLAGMPLDEFLSLNPGHNRPVIKTVGTSTLLFPADKAAAFAANLDKHEHPLISWQAYTLKPGDTLARVAARHGMAVEQLKQVNGLTGNHRVGPGTTLLVAAAAGAAQHLPDMAAHPVMLIPTSAQPPKPALAARAGATAKDNRGKPVKLAQAKPVPGIRTKTVKAAAAKPAKMAVTRTAKKPAPPSAKVVAAKRPPAQAPAAAKKILVAQKSR